RRRWATPRWARSSRRKAALRRRSSTSARPCGFTRTMPTPTTSGASRSGTRGSSTSPSRTSRRRCGSGPTTSTRAGICAWRENGPGIPARISRRNARGVRAWRGKTCADPTRRRISDDRELVGALLEAPIDLRGGVEGAFEESPARHPFPGPARLVLAHGAWLFQLDTTQDEVVGLERRHLGVAGPVADEVRDVAALVGVDAPDRSRQRSQQGRVRLGADARHRDPRAVKERGRDEATARLLGDGDPRLLQHGGLEIAAHETGESLG